MNNKKNIGLVTMLIMIVVVVAYAFSTRDASAPADVPKTNEPVASSTIPTTPVVTEPKAELQAQAYTDKDAQFSINLPKGWKILTNTYQASTSNVLFGNGSSTIIVKRYERTDKVEQALENLKTVKEFYAFIMLGIEEDIQGYTTVATSTATIGGLSAYRVTGSYVGPQSKKQVTQYAYVVLTDKNYYLIGADMYADRWSVDKDAVLASIATLKFK